MFIQEHSGRISFGASRYYRLILSGDLNTHINKKTSSKALDQMNLLYELTQHVNEAPHQHDNTLALVTSTGLDVSSVSVLDLLISDHHCVLFEAKLILAMTEKFRRDLSMGRLN